MGQASLLRQWVILQTLAQRHYGVTAADLAAEAEVNEKTVRRDLALFRRLGFPLEELIGDHGLKSWRLKPDHSAVNVSFSFDEALALYIGRRLLDPLAGTFVGQAAQNAFRKIRANLGHTALAYLDGLATSIHATHLGAGDYSEKDDVFDVLLLGMEERKAVRIAYQSMRATEPVTYEVCPYAVILHKHHLYLVAHSREHREVRHFKLDRISQAEGSSSPFHRPDGFDVAEHLADSFGVFRHSGGRPAVVRVLFAASIARYVLESKWHPSQKLSKRRDGGVLAEFRLGNTEEIKRWILGFGAAAEVLEPRELREEIRRELRESVLRYEAIRSPITANTKRPR